MIVCRHIVKRLQKPARWNARLSTTPARRVQPEEICLAAHEKLLAAYGTRQEGRQPLEEWMQTYYRRPHPELLPGAFLEALRTPNAFAGPRSLACAVFLSEVFRGVLTQRAHLHETFGVLLAALRIDGVTEERVTAAASDESASSSSSSSSSSSLWAEKLDTVLRGLYLTNSPLLDEYLSDTAAEWRKEGRKQMESQIAPAPGHPSGETLLALADSIFPPDELRGNRTHILDWPLPVMNLSAFEKHVSESRYPVYGCTQYWWSRTNALWTFGPRGPQPSAASFAVLSPMIASDLTMAMVDAFWAHFYATGDTRAVLRVLDIGTLYMEFFDEYGDKYVTQMAQSQGQEQGQAQGQGHGQGPEGSGSSNTEELPDELRDDPYTLMRFNPSRYALYTLLVHAGSHTVVGDAFGSQLGELLNTTRLHDPTATDDLLTGFGRRRLELMKLLAPSIAEQAKVASVHGVGSGNYPESYAALGDGVLGSAALLPSRYAAGDQSATLLAGGEGELHRLLSAVDGGTASGNLHHSAPAANTAATTEGGVASASSAGTSAGSNNAAEETAQTSNVVGAGDRERDRRQRKSSMRR
jgi:hypothetical protein